jgi:predicted nucleotidyltransferase
MYGLSEKSIEKLVGVFEQMPEISKVILFGSRAKGNFRNGSDIDLALFGNKLDLKTLFKIEIALDDLMLPWKIDLVLHTTIDNPQLEEHISRIGKVFFERKLAGKT